MSSDNNDWVREGTPHDAVEAWDAEVDEYGTVVSPTEWDDYSAEQSVVVTPPQRHSAPEEGAFETTSDTEDLTEGRIDDVAGGDMTAAPAWGADNLDGGVFEDVEVAEDASSDLLTAQSGDLDADQADLQSNATAGFVAEGDDLPVEQVELGDEADARWDAALADVNDDAESVETPAAPPGQAPDEGDDYRSDDAPQPTPVGDADVDGMEPERTEPVESLADDATERAWDEADADEFVAENSTEDGDLGVDPDDDLAGPSLDEDDLDGDGIDDDDAERSPIEDEQGDVDVDDDLDQTRIRPLGAGAAAGLTAAGATAAAATTALPDGLYRAAADETTVIPTAAALATPYPETDLAAEDEEIRRQEQIAADRRARNQRLGLVDTSQENALREAPLKTKRTTDRWNGAMGLFLLRLITAAVLGTAAYRIILDQAGTAEAIGRTLIPQPELAAQILGYGLAAMAVLLVLGLFQRLVGLLLLAVAVASLVFIRWGSINPFVTDQNSFPFVGDKDLLLAGIGFLLLLVGGGGWGVDGAFRRSRAAAKAERRG